MTESVKGRPVAEAEALFERFHELVTGRPAQRRPTAAGLGKLAVFAGVREFPVRVKCATLAWHTLRAALADGAGRVDGVSDERWNAIASPNRRDRRSAAPTMRAVGDQIVQQLQTVFDPEIPVDIYELGLIYEVTSTRTARSRSA